MQLCSMMEVSKNAERVGNSAFCIEMGAVTAPSAARGPISESKWAKYRAVLCTVLPLSFLLTLI